MSLNWKEINAILREAMLIGKRIDDIAQPDFEQLLLVLRNREAQRSERRQILRISHKTHRVVFHMSEMDIPAVAKPIPRFMQLTRARLRGGVIESCMQYHDQRIVRIGIDTRGQRFALWIRLWSGKANTILTDEHGMIIDAYLRKPQSGEISGANIRDLIWKQLGEDQKPISEPYRCELRTHSYRLYNQMIDQRYRIEDQNYARKQLVKQVILEAEKRIQQPIAEHHKRRRTAQVADAAELRAIAILLQQEAHRISAGITEISLLDPQIGRKRTITLDPHISAQQNAQRYFTKYKEQRRTEEWQSAQEQQIDEKRAALIEIKNHAPHMNINELRATLKQISGAKKAADRSGSKNRPSTLGHRFYSNGFNIIVGKTAAESDQLMRRVARGNDVWLHARGVRGSSVFIHHRKGKSVPLEVLYDAATLAHYFSKARGNGHVDVFYTEVKHLRRAKHAPQGTFIPFHDSGLTFNFDHKRLMRLQQSQSYGTLLTNKGTP